MSRPAPVGRRPARTCRWLQLIFCHIAAVAHIGRHSNRQVDKPAGPCTLYVYTAEHI